MNTMKYYGIMQKVEKNSMILLFMVLVFSCRNDNQTKIYYYTKNCTSCDFIPLKEEYVSGAVLECDLELIKDTEVPRDFKMQVENWEKRKEN